jgi:hypothetical protein
VRHGVRGPLALLILAAVVLAAAFWAPPFSPTAALLGDTGNPPVPASQPTPGASAQPAPSATPVSLPEDITTTATAVARQVLTADLTGVGRSAFPDYWPPGGYRALYRSIDIQAATARPESATPDLVEVTLLWTGIRPDGVAVEADPTTVRLRRGAGGWTPLHPWEP